MSERIITADMGPFERFQVGDIVATVRDGDGKVLANDGKHIVVAYPLDINVKGACEPFTCTYDQRWFDDHPRRLFHRNTAPLTTQPTVR